MEKVTTKQRQIIQVEGTGKEKNQAFANALNQIHNRVLKGKNDVIVRIEPLDIQIIKAEQESFTERFLFFFLPRTRVDYRVLLDVEVEITLIEVESIKFVEKRVTDPNGLPIPFGKKKRIQKEAN
ncbi:DUF4312 family protein [Enterococcus caccae]|uniref:Cytoplasmic protein n=1 Tax=Enterococcus caccae ATCC BAA-1240 TaxID=1158612 RepID=R3WMI9_9ENTE|nr:DUF4312 family protein [Enterococcus caccae]EOL49056.1 hypothetical protein UC7_00901 [Enterococcus caccae ATCC BAA-1240]EOT65449.1 hypothetical protein I580_01205 [Enterococcus caccae ATCC BAA-1240]OJG25091.1 hypothetical protein RU98_GL001192 [Enterococcus caccae]